ncbi:hypothetical protein F2Q70_00015136 [Brassica cretica]|uniref:Large ribosomal subunit protein bL9c n=2 Tax=Brassica cretica TaxID=69181 RepID=A0A8S9HXB5_BRACR|nr:hypothetical protein F2Q70_00015136 [Brassica cretica]
MAHVAQSRNVIRHVVSRGTAFHKTENAIHHPLLFACQGVRYRKLEVILTTGIEKLGKGGETVKVAPGYFRNHLMPKLLAVPNIDKYAHLIREQRKTRNYEEKEEVKVVHKSSEVQTKEFEKAAKRLANANLVLRKLIDKEKFKNRSSKEDKPDVQTPVTKEEIVSEVARQLCVKIDPDNVVLTEPLATFGEYEVPLKFPKTIPLPPGTVQWILKVKAMELDLLSLDSVVKFSNAWNARLAPLHVLINNAGIFAMGGCCIDVKGNLLKLLAILIYAEEQKFSKDGYEHHMQVNHLAPALLSLLLLPSLNRASPCRIINVNSVMHYVGFVDPDDMNVVSGRRKFSSLVGYSGSKLAQVMFSNVLFKRLPLESRISVVCLSPGIVLTNVARDLPRSVQVQYALIPYFIFSPQEGCRSSLFSATDAQIPEHCEKLKTGDKPICTFISQDCKHTKPSEEAQSLETANRVWEKTVEMIGLPLDALERLIQGQEVQCRYGTHQE